MWNKIAGGILRYRIAILLFITIFTAFMAYHAKFVKMEYEYAQMLPDTDTISIQYKKFKDLFGEDSNSLVIGFQDSDFFTPNKIDDWMLMIDSLKQINGVSFALSVTDVFDIKKNTKERKFEVHRVFDRKNNHFNIDSLKKRFFSLPFYKNLLYNSKSNVYVSLLTLSTEIVNSPARVQMVDSIQIYTERFASKYGIKVHYSGLPYTRTKIASMIEHELLMFTLLALFVTAFILFLFFKSFRVVFFSIIVVGFGVIWAVGSMHLLGYDITILTGMLPPLLIVIGIPNCVFLLNKYFKEYNLHENKIKALQRSISKMGSAIFLTNLTTASGFATFIVTKNRILTEFGIIASLNILGLYLISMTILPIVYSFLLPPKQKHVKHLKSKFTTVVINKLAFVVTNKRKYIYVAIVMIMGLAVYGITQIKSTGYIVDDIPKDHPVYVDLKFFEKHLNGLMPFEIAIDTKRRKGAMKLSTIKRVDRLQKKLLKYKELSRSISIADGVKFARQAYYNGVESQYKLPSSSEAKFILSYLKIDSDKKNMLSNFVDSTGQYLRISVKVKDIGTNNMKILYENIKAEVDSIFPTPKYNTLVTGSSIVFTSGTVHLINNLFTSLALAVALISLFMAFMFSSFRMIVVSLLPNLIPLVVTGGIMGYFGISIKPSTVLVFSIAFGISVDNAIHFLAKYRQELIQNNWNISSSVIAALKETGVSIINTAGILFFGFGIFVLSDFGGTVALGVLVSITLLVALFANLLLLPAMLLTLERMITTKAFKSPFLKLFDEILEPELDTNKIAESEVKKETP